MPRADSSFGTAGVPPASADCGTRWRSRGYLPHVDAPNLVQHVVFRLADSLPAQIVRDIGRMGSDHRVRAADAALDRGLGKRDLMVEPVATLVETALLAFDAKRYALAAWCIMPNHVHVLVETRSGFGLDQVVHAWKSYTAKKANGLLGRTGSFWAPEYFDRFMRDENQRSRTAAYIEANPVTAGLCANVSDWRFSSAWQEKGGRDARGPIFGTRR